LRDRKRDIYVGRAVGAVSGVRNASHRVTQEIPARKRTRSRRPIIERLRVGPIVDGAGGAAKLTVPVGTGMPLRPVAVTVIAVYSA
jgi:hypothetical protein